jgi:glyoxylase-like metal-dependent hydrolase (beta-lactamase superfamily II)
LIKPLRWLLQSTLATLASLSMGLLLPLSAHAAAPMVKTQAPGFYRLMLGDFEITALSDGTVKLPMDKLLHHAAPGEVQKDLANAFLGTPVETSVNAFLVNTGAKLVLIDTGAAGLFGPTLGQLVTNLKAAGYTPDQVDEVYITHMHADHVGGLSRDGQRVFVNATVRADQHDAGYWLSPAHMADAPPDAQGGFKNAMASFKPYIDAGKFKPFDGATELVPGIRVEPTPGHTPGHSSFVVESQGQRLYVVGDLIHVGAVQFSDPAVTIQFDSNEPMAATERKKIFDTVSRQGALIAAAHLAFPGLGHLRQSGNGYNWVPLNYSASVEP